MDYSKILSKKVFVVVGDTVNPEKYAAKIKMAMQEAGYIVYSVPKELESLDDVPVSLDVVDLCINPIKGLELLKSTIKAIPFVVIQPGAGSDEIYRFLDDKGVPYIDGCLLKALSQR